MSKGNKKQGKAKKQEYSKEEEEQFVQTQLENYESAVKKKHLQQVSGSLRREYQENTNYKEEKQSQDNKKSRKRSEDFKQEQPHYKELRKDQRAEKHLMGVHGNNLKRNKDFNPSNSKKSDKKFSSYQINENNLFNDKFDGRSYQNYGKHFKERRYEQRDRYSDEEDLLDQYCNNSRRNDRERNQRNYKSNRRDDWKKDNYKNTFKQYKDHWTEEKIQEGLLNNTVFTGIISIREGQRQTATIKCSQFLQKIMLDDAETQNRATENAEVYFRIIKAIEKKEDEKKKTTKKQNDSSSSISESENEDEKSNEDLDSEEEEIEIKFQEIKKNIEKKLSKDSKEKQKKLNNKQQKQESPEVNKVQPEGQEKKEQNGVKKQSSQEQLNKTPEEGNDDDWEDMDESIESDESLSEEPQEKYKKEKQQQLFVEKVSQKAEKIDLDQYKDKKLIGEVVGIKIDPLKDRDIVGMLEFKKKSTRKISEGKNLQDTIFYNFHTSFKPLNKRLPWFKFNQISENTLKEVCDDLDINNIDHLEELLNKMSKYYFIGKKLGWDKKSYYPTINIEKKFGQSGDIETECAALLIEHQVYQDDFGEECMAEMENYKKFQNEKNEYIIPEDERAKRLDLTKEIICTVDPLTARDLDDALSINEVEPGIFEVGVHIADVSHFVSQESFVDQEAQLRTTSVYLVHRVIPMLPRILCENLCSLNPDVERLAFSVFFYIKRDGEVLWKRPIRTHKTIIKSCAKMNYDAVNLMISGEVKAFNEIPPNLAQNINMSKDVDQKALWDKLLLLNEIGQNRRNKRHEEGSLTIEKSKLRFKLGEDLYPLSYEEEVRKQAQFMVEEWMLLANQFVAMKVVEFDKKNALLRQHPPPKKEKIEFFKKLLRTCKMESMIDKLDISNPSKLRQTLDVIKSDDSLKQEAKDLLSYKLIKLMEAAKYFIVQDIQKEEWYHYALNFEVYTHFTSPIRRYPDIVVHRLLFNSILSEKAQKQQQENTDEMEKNQELMLLCNKCKMQSRRVSDGCEKIFMCLYLKKNPITTEAYVMDVNRLETIIVIPKFNLEIKKKNEQFKNVLKKEIIRSEDADYNVLLLHYEDENVKEAKRIFVLEPLTKIIVYLTASNSFPIDYHVDIAVPQRKINLNNEVEIQYKYV